MRRRRKRFSIAEPSRQQERPYSHATLAVAERPKASDSHNGWAGTRAGNSLLQLQREYGNRYVQRVLALSTKGRGETGSSSGVRVQDASNRAIGQLLNLKQALQTPDKPARGFHGLV